MLPNTMGPEELAGAKTGNIVSSLELIEFHARSINRVVVLEALMAGPIERRDLEDVTGISRPTLSRILDDFEDRGWVERDHHRYEATLLGTFVNREFSQLIDRMTVVHKLQDVVAWLPEGGFGFDLSRLSAADIITPQKEDALAPTHHIVKRFQDASMVRAVSFTLLPDCLQTSYQQVVDGGQTFEAVFQPQALVIIDDDPIMKPWAHEMLRSGNATIYRYDGAIPYVAIVIDERVCLCLSGNDGAPRAVIDSDDDEIFDWAQETFDSYRARATAIKAERFAS